MACLCAYVCLLCASQRKNSCTFHLYFDIQTKKGIFSCSRSLARWFGFSVSAVSIVLSVRHSVRFGSKSYIEEANCSFVHLLRFTERKEESEKCFMFIVFKITRSTLVRRHFTFGPQSGYNTHAHTSESAFLNTSTLTHSITNERIHTHSYENRNK